jgi:hypothetical protein
VGFGAGESAVKQALTFETIPSPLSPKHTTYYFEKGSTRFFQKEGERSRKSSSLKRTVGGLLTGSNCPACPFQFKNAARKIGNNWKRRTLLEA